MNDLNDLYYFAMVVDHGGFAAAERALGIPKSRLSRRISSAGNRPGRAPAAALHAQLRGDRCRQQRASPCPDHAGRGPGRARGGGSAERRAARQGAGQRAGVDRPEAVPEAAAEVPGPVPEGAAAAEHQQPPRGRDQRRHRRRPARALRLDDDGSLVMRSFGQIQELLVASPKYLDRAGRPQTRTNLPTTSP